MAQCGKPDPPLAFCKLPVWVDVGTVKLAVREDSEAREADARETEAADAEDAAAADDDDSIDERIESAYVVSGREMSGAKIVTGDGSLTNCRKNALG